MDCVPFAPDLVTSWRQDRFSPEPSHQAVSEGSRDEPGWAARVANLERDMGSLQQGIKDILARLGSGLAEAADRTQQPATSRRKSSGNSSRCVTSSATSTRTKRMNTSGIIRRSHSRITAQSLARSVNSMPPSTRMRRSRILKNILKSNLLKMNEENNLYHREMKLFRMLHQRKPQSLQKLSKAKVWQATRKPSWKCRIQLRRASEVA